MPFRSEAQKRYLYAKEPAIAERWQKETPEGTKLPEHVRDDKALRDAAKRRLSMIKR